MSNVKWDLDDPSQAEEALNFLYSLPDNEYNSEAEPDSEAEDELNALDRDNSSFTHSSTPTSSRDSSIVMHSPVTADYYLNDISESRNTLSAVQTENDSENCSPNIPLLVDDSENQASNGEKSNTPLTPVEEESDEEQIEWSEESDYFANFSVAFDQPPSLNTDLVFNKEISYFLEIFDENLFTLIVLQSNLYAEQESIKNWSPLTIPELKAYIGCLILMGIHQLPRLENYWSSDPLLRVNSIADVMNSKRFKKITEALHCNNNESCPPRGNPRYDKLYKLRPVIDHLNNNCHRVYNCSSHLSVDEAMIAFKGRCSFKQYMPLKPVKRGYKVWCLADSETGFISKFDVYTGKTTEATVDKDVGLGENVVLKLTEHLVNKNYLVTFDNFFTSVPLLKKLHKKGIYGIGTVRSNRKDLPEMMKRKDKMKRGEFMFKTRGVLAAVKWQDSKAVTLLTTAVSPRDITTVKRTNKDGSRDDVYCPKWIYTIDLWAVLISLTKKKKDMLSEGGQLSGGTEYFIF